MEIVSSWNDDITVNGGADGYDHSSVTLGAHVSNVSTLSTTSEISDAFTACDL